MELATALDVLGLDADADATTARRAYRQALHRTHPDVAGGDPGATERTARLTEAFAVVDAALAAGGGRLPPAAPTPAATASPPAPPAPTADGGPVVRLADDALGVRLPAEETFALLHEAGGLVGEVAYVDPQLGLLEVVVRFEGGPSCSVVLTLQGRVGHTEVLAAMASLEAAPTPSLAPVTAALAEAATGVAAAWGWASGSDGPD